MHGYIIWHVQLQLTENSHFPVLTPQILKILWYRSTVHYNEFKENKLQNFAYGYNGNIHKTILKPNKSLMTVANATNALVAWPICWVSVMLYFLFSASVMLHPWLRFSNTLIRFSHDALKSLTLYCIHFNLCHHTC